MFGRGGLLLALCLTACAPSPAVDRTPTIAPSPPTPIATPSATLAPSPSASAGDRGFAVVCGTISEFVNDTPQSAGSLVLTAPGRDPMRFTIPAGRLGSGGAGGYVCIGVQRGTPRPLFDGFVPGGVSAFVPQGTTPATFASPAPTGFVLPQACVFAASPTIGAAQTDWLVDCGDTRNRDARGTLGSELQRQGWTTCGSGLASARWQKSGIVLVISESSLAPGDFPRLTQPSTNAGCT